MLAHVLSRFLDPLSSSAAFWLAKVGLRARTIAILGMVYAAAATAFIAAQAYLTGLLFLILNRACAELARASEGRRSPLIVQLPDLIVYAAIGFGFAVADRSRAFATTFLLLGIVILTACSTEAGEKEPASRSASFVAGSALFISMATACFAPRLFELIAYVAGFVCFPAAGLILASANVRSAGPAP